MKIVKKDQKAFSNFIDYSLDKEGKIIKPKKT